MSVFKKEDGSRYFFTVKSNYRGFAWAWALEEGGWLAEDEMIHDCKVARAIYVD